MKTFIVSLLLLSCSLVLPGQNPGLDVNNLYMKDMVVKVNGKSIEGMGVVPKAAKYKFEVVTEGKLDLFKFESCHREWIKEKAWDKKRGKSKLFGWVRSLGENKKKITFEYIPTRLEKTYCPLFLTGLEHAKGNHSWAYMDFQDLTLPAKLECNGVTNSPSGVAICQSKKGLVQSIIFTDEMVVSPGLKSGEPSSRGTTFEFTMKRDIHVFTFTRIKRPHLEFRLTTYGYDRIAVRRK